MLSCIPFAFVFVCVMRVFACVLVGVCAFAKVSPWPFLSLCFPDGLISFSIVVVFALLCRPIIIYGRGGLERWYEELR